MMMDKEMKLKSCPCCGGRAKLLGQRTFYVECQKCFLATDRYARPQFAAEAWNRRTEVTTMAELDHGNVQHMLVRTYGEITTFKSK